MSGSHMDRFDSGEIAHSTYWTGPTTVVARSKAWTVLARSNAGIVGSNPTQGMDSVCAFILCM
jgi:hypothetical protein